VKDDTPDTAVVLVAGATGGIGSAVSRMLAARGDRVMLAARNRSRLAQLASEIDGESVGLDATDLGQVERAVRGIHERAGRLDGIVNCVGSLLLKPAHLTTELEWENTVRTNLGSAFAVVRAAGKTMRSGGSVVLVSSAAARTGLPNHEAIAAAKAGIIGLTRSAAASYAGRGLRFNAVAPGLVRTRMTARITDNETAEKASTRLHALGRLGRPEDVARAIVWLLDSDQDWVTGQVIGVDGGLASVRPRS
jgi:NAD(P)-dependent dehydrogenase (short-subunit alcohol dehydrogenase family)